MCVCNALNPFIISADSRALKFHRFVEEVRVYSEYIIIFHAERCFTNSSRGLHKCENSYSSFPRRQMSKFIKKKIRLRARCGVFTRVTPQSKRVRGGGGGQRFRAYIYIYTSSVGTRNNNFPRNSLYARAQKSIRIARYMRCVENPREVRPSIYICVKEI